MPGVHVQGRGQVMTVGMYHVGMQDNYGEHGVNMQKRSFFRIDLKLVLHIVLSLI